MRSTWDDEQDGGSLGMPHDSLVAVSEKWPLQKFRCKSQNSITIKIKTFDLAQPHRVHTSRSSKRRLNFLRTAIFHCIYLFSKTLLSTICSPSHTHPNRNCFSDTPRISQSRFPFLALWPPFSQQFTSTLFTAWIFLLAIYASFLHLIFLNFHQIPKTEWISNCKCEAK